jgi:putative transcriptional regulator
MSRFMSDDIETAGFLTGQLLLAMPHLTEPPFVHAVIYVCAHTSRGAIGIVVNSPLASPTFEDLLSQLDIPTTPATRAIRLCSGGPVEHSRGFVLHTSDWTADGSLCVDDRLALTASLDILKAIAAGGGPRDGLLALGYAGWGPGQLDAEMRDNAWLSVPVEDIDLVLGHDFDTKWHRAMAHLRVDPVWLSGASGHA